MLLHQICHNEIHATFTETELARDFATIDALKAHPRLAKLATWLSGKDPSFYRRTVGGRRKKGRN